MNDHTTATNTATLTFNRYTQQNALVIPIWLDVFDMWSINKIRIRNTFWWDGQAGSTTAFFFHEKNPAIIFLHIFRGMAENNFDNLTTFHFPKNPYNFCHTFSVKWQNLLFII